MRRVVLSIFLLVGIVGCDSGSSGDDRWWGEAEAIKNGRLWTPVPAATDVKRGGEFLAAASDSFVFRMSARIDQGLEEYLSFGQLPREVGKYKLSKLAEENRFTAHALFSVIVGGDATTDVYYPDQDLENWIAIDSYDPLTEQIEGRFQLVLMPELRSSPDAPDTLKIEQGRFLTVIVREIP